MLRGTGLRGDVPCGFAASGARKALALSHNAGLGGRLDACLTSSDVRRAAGAGGGEGTGVVRRVLSRG